MRQVIRKAIDYEQFHGDDPTTKHINVPKKKGYIPFILNANEVGELLEGFKGHYLEPTVICSVLLGLRRGESFALHWEDINLRNGEVKITKTYQCIEGKCMYLPTKTVKSTRVCYLPQDILPRMRELGKGQVGRIAGETSPNKMAKDYKD